MSFCGNIDSLDYLFHWRQLLFLNLQGDMTAGWLDATAWMVVAQEAGYCEGDLAAFEFVAEIAVDMGTARLPTLPYRDSCF